MSSSQSPLNFLGANSISGNLVNVSTIPNQLTSSIQSLMSSAGLDPSLVNLVSEDVFASGTPKTLPAFIQAVTNDVYSLAGESVPSSQQPSTNAEGDIYYTSSNTLYSSLLSTFNTDIDSSGISGLQTVTSSSFPGSTLNDDLLYNAMNNFLPAATDVTSLASLDSQFSQFTTQLASILSADAAAGQLSYQNVLAAYTGNSTIPSTLLASFIQGQISANGFFIPSNDFNNWVNTAISHYQLSISGTPSLTQSSVGATSNETDIINNIFALLTTFIQTLQAATAAQANTLNIFSQWQQAYTNLQNQIVYIVNAPGKGQDNYAISSDSTVSNNYNSYNATLTQGIQAKLQVVQDNAKNQQTTINNSNSAVQQQTSTATSLLQEVSSILSSLYPSGG